MLPIAVPGAPRKGTRFSWMFSVGSVPGKVRMQQDPLLVGTLAGGTDQWRCPPWLCRSICRPIRGSCKTQYSPWLLISMPGERRVLKPMVQSPPWSLECPKLLKYSITRKQAQGSWRQGFKPHLWSLFAWSYKSLGPCFSLLGWRKTFLLIAAALVFCLFFFFPPCEPR